MFHYTSIRSSKGVGLILNTIDVIALEPPHDSRYYPQQTFGHETLSEAHDNLGSLML